MAVRKAIPEARKVRLPERILHLSEHVRQHKKDRFTQRALVTLVGKRRKMLDYLKERDIERYRAILQQLNLRK